MLFIKLLIDKINDSDIDLVSNSRKEFFEKLLTSVLSCNEFSTHRSIVSWIYSTIVKKSLIVYSFGVRDSSNGTKNFASLYVGVPMADK